MKALLLLALTLTACDSATNEAADCDLNPFACALPQAPYCAPADYEPCPPGLYGVRRYATADGVVDLRSDDPAPAGGVLSLEFCAYSLAAPGAGGQGWRNAYSPAGEVTAVEYSDLDTQFAWHCGAGPFAETFQRHYPNPLIQCFDPATGAELDCGGGGSL